MLPLPLRELNAFRLVEADPAQDVTRMVHDLEAPAVPVVLCIRIRRPQVAKGREDLGGRGPDVSGVDAGIVRKHDPGVYEMEEAAHPVNHVEGLC
jgi:hypothetical protein